MLIALLSIAILLVILLGLVFGALTTLEKKIDRLSSDVSTLRTAVSPQTLGSRAGRSVPTLEEINAARNRIDAQGVAHPGGG